MDCAKYKLWGRKSNVLPVNQEVKAPFLCDIFIKYSSKKTTTGYVCFMLVSTSIRRKVLAFCK